MAVDLVLRDRVENWARYSRGSLHRRPGRCASAEGRYVRSSGYDEEERRSPSVPIDERDALQVEAAWRTLAQQDRRVLKWHWIENRPPGWIMRMLGKRNDQFKPAKLGALLALSRALDDPIAAVHNSATPALGAARTVHLLEVD